MSRDKRDYRALTPVFRAALDANEDTPEGRKSAWVTVTAAGHDVDWHTFKRMIPWMRTIPFFPPWNEVMKEGEGNLVRYAQRAVVEREYREKLVRIRPGFQAAKAAQAFPDVGVAVTPEDFQRAYTEHLKLERFEKFCEEDGIPGGRKEMPDGSVQFYAPDAMGNPTHVLTQHPNGETS